MAMDKEGVLPIDGALVQTVFIDPPALLSSEYVDFAVDSRAYYARMRELPRPRSDLEHESHQSSNTKKRKRKRKEAYTLNAKELVAERRHQEARCFLLDAHKAFLANEAALARLKNVIACNASSSSSSRQQDEEIDFVQLSRLFQAPLYDITSQDDPETIKSVPLFNNLVEVGSSKEVLANSAGCTFVLPKGSRFLMSDFAEIHQLIPEAPSDGYNLLLIDPPWENKSVHRRSLYPTLPNKYLLSLPIQQLVHSEGALLGLWITNREKLWQFVERELFPAWGVVPVGVWYWLKITGGGEMVSELDLSHHKPYECLLLARDKKASKEAEQIVPCNLVAISMPAEHSRKPPLGLLLSEFAPGPRPVKALELFAREMNVNWTSWGNEPLRFQSQRYFQNGSCLT